MPPEVNVLGTLIFVFALIAILLQILWARRRRGVEEALAKDAELAQAQPFPI